MHSVMTHAYMHTYIYTCQYIYTDMHHNPVPFKGIWCQVKVDPTFFFLKTKTKNKKTPTSTSPDSNRNVSTIYFKKGTFPCSAHRNPNIAALRKSMRIREETEETIFTAPEEKQKK